MHLYGLHTFVWENVENFKRLLLWASVAQISCGASLGQGNERLLKWTLSTDQDGRHAMNGSLVLDFNLTFVSLPHIFM